MKKQYKMKKIREIIDSDENLIGNKDVPTHGSNLESMANGTTDYNSSVGHQPFRYDMLGRFGFTLMPFFEGEENQSQMELVNDLTNLFDDYFVEILKYYAKNPNKLKSDYRKKIKDDEDIHGENNGEFVKKTMEIVQKHFENAFDEPENIDEWNVSEKIVNKTEKNGITTKDDDGEITSKEIKKIAGLINKMDKKDVKKIVNLLEYE